MKSDRELLELAAKAARIAVDINTQSGWICHRGMAWDPIADDGDALRLAVKLGLVIDTDYNNGAAVGSAFLDMECCREADHPARFGSDRNAATRRAIVRAAAAIGEGMK